MKRYFIGYKLPPNPDRALRRWYLRNFAAEIPVKQLHICLVPAFSLKKSGSTNEVKNVLGKISKINQNSFSFSTLAVFNQFNKHILYLPIKPAKPLRELSQKLKSRLADYLEYDLSVYQNRQIPRYLPHVSLNYDFLWPEKLPAFPPTAPFILNELTLFVVDHQLFLLTENPRNYSPAV